MRWVLALVLFLLLTTSAQAASSSFVAINCDPATNVGSTVFFNVRDSDGIFRPRVGNASCQGSLLLPNYDGHRGVEDVTADGRYVLYVKAVGSTRTWDIAEPGKGVNNVLKVYDRSTGLTYNLMADSEAGPVPKRYGVMWADFNANATKVSWSQLLKAASFSHPAGTWQLRVADIGPGWTLQNERAWTPPEDAFVEAYGWVPGTSRVIFASESGIGSAWTSAQLQTLPETLSGTPTRVTKPFVKATWCWSGIDGDPIPSWCNPPNENLYHEFANWTLSGRLLTSIIREAKDSGMDLWSMNPDGTDRHRMTYYGGRPNGSGGYDQVVGFPAPSYSIVLGGMAVLPDGSLLVGRTASANATTIDAYRIIP